MQKKRWLRLALIVSISTGILYAKCDANAQKLVRAYPHFLKTCSHNDIVWRDGTKMRYDDGKPKSFDRLLNHADIQDMFHYPYPKGSWGYSKTKAPAKNFDPGRIRNETFFRKMYGNSAAQVRRNLVRIPWLKRSTGGRYYVTVTRINGVDRALSAVSDDLDRLIARKPSMKKYLVPLGGTFTWRHIAGTHRLSVHSFGAAIDINVKHSSYWRWSKGHYRYRNEIPLEIVRIFEKQGFIWGGKWYHYDTMHFEYRPELLGERAAEGNPRLVSTKKEGGTGKSSMGILSRENDGEKF